MDTTPLVAFTTTELSRSVRVVIEHARTAARGALIRDGEDGRLLRLLPAEDLDTTEAVRRYADTLLPLVIRGVEGSKASDFPGAGWLVHLPPGARQEFLVGAIERLLEAVDGMGFDGLDRWFVEWHEEARLHRAGILGASAAAGKPAERPRRATA